MPRASMRATSKAEFPSDADYKTLQDYLFRYIAREAGRLGMAVHFHTGGGCGGYFAMEAQNPLLLDSVFNDPTLRKTNFVMLHGGAGGFEQSVPYLLMKPNVYADFSEQTWMTLAAPHRRQHSLHAGVLSREGSVRYRPVSA